MVWWQWLCYVLMIRYGFSLRLASLHRFSSILAFQHPEVSIKYWTSNTGHSELHLSSSWLTEHCLASSAFFLNPGTLIQVSMTLFMLSWTARVPLLSPWDIAHIIGPQLHLQWPLDMLTAKPRLTLPQEARIWRVYLFCQSPFKQMLIKCFCNFIPCNFQWVGTAGAFPTVLVESGGARSSVQHLGSAWF